MRVGKAELWAFEFSTFVMSPAEYMIVEGVIHIKLHFVFSEAHLVFVFIT